MIVRRTDVITEIERLIQGHASSAEVAGWAFDRFYAIEQGEEELASEDEEVIAMALDDLMFADDDSFALDDVDLQRLIALLQTP